MMTRYCHAALLVLPALLWLLALAYVHHVSRGRFWQEVVFWLCVALAFATIFSFVSIADLSGPEGTLPSLTATMYSRSMLSDWLWPAWAGTVVVGLLGLGACLIHVLIAKERRQERRPVG